MPFIEEMKIACPFCKEKEVTAVYIPPITQSRTSRTSARAITKFYRTKEKYEVQSSCPACGKSVKEIQKALGEGVKNTKKEKERLEQLKEQGLDFTVITTKM